MLITQALLEEFGVTSQLWATEFGWGSFEGIRNKEGTPEPPPADALFMDYVSEQEQAVYILRAFEMAQELDSSWPYVLVESELWPTTWHAVQRVRIQFACGLMVRLAHHTTRCKPLPRSKSTPITVKFGIY